MLFTTYDACCGPQSFVLDARILHYVAAGPSFLYWRRMNYSSWLKFNLYSTFYSTAFCLGFKTLSVFTPGQPTRQKSATTVCIYTVCLPETCGTCPSPVHPSSQLALFKCHRDVSHLYRLYVDCGPRLCSEVSSLITMSSLVWSSVTKAPFTGAACLLSSISLEFHCSGWEGPEASRQTWSQWRNMALPSPTL